VARRHCYRESEHPACARCPRRRAVRWSCVTEPVPLSGRAAPGVISSRTALPLPFDRHVRCFQVVGGAADKVERQTVFDPVAGRASRAPGWVVGAHQISLDPFVGDCLERCRWGPETTGRRIIRVVRQSLCGQFTSLLSPHTWRGRSQSCFDY